MTTERQAGWMDVLKYGIGLGLILWAIDCAAQPLTLHDPAFLGNVVGAAAAASCTTVNVAYESDSSRTQFANQPGTTWVASLINASSLTNSFSCCKAEFLFDLGGSPSMTLTALIWANDDKGTPADLTDDTPSGAPLYTSTSTLDASAITAKAWYSFDFGSVALTVGTHYWIGINSSAFDGSNYCWWQRGSTGAALQIRKSTDGSTWTVVSQTRQSDARLYSSP